MKNIKASIIIPTLNEEKYLPKLLESIKRQDFKDYEVIVADGNSKDRTVSIAKRYGASIAKGGNPSKARNSGASIAKGEYFFFLDADTSIPQGFIGGCISEMERRGIKLATCRLKPVPDKIIDRIIHAATNLLVMTMQYIWPHALGICIIVRKGVFRKAGGFDDTIRIAEDHAFVSKASKITPLRLLKQEICVSTRRWEKEGRVMLTLKYIRVGLHRLFRGEVRDDIVEYEFGSFGGKKD